MVCAYNRPSPVYCAIPVLMTDNTLDKYFSSTPAKSVKRARSYSSPGSEDTSVSMSGEKVGDLTHEQLMVSLGQLMDHKLSSLATKNDFKLLSGQVNALSDENKALKEEIGLLRQHAETVKAKLVDLEGRSRRNNLIFKGLTWGPKTKDFRHVISKFCSDNFGSDDRLWINRAHPLGRNRDAIIAHFPSDSDVDYIMSRTRNLKGTKYVVHRDYPSEVREKRAYLMAVRAEVERVTGTRRMPLVFDHITIERVRFTWESGCLKAGREDGGEKLQTILNHDFSDFLEKLRQQGAGKPRHSPESAAYGSTAAQQTVGAGESSGDKGTTNPTSEGC